MRRASAFKACRKCRYLVQKKETKCPVCGSENFSDRWRGLVVIIDKDSFVAELLEIPQEGYYAVKVL